MIGSITSGSVTAVVVTPLAPSSQNRTAIEFYVNTGVAYITDQPGAAVQQGIPVTPSSPLKLDYERHGDLVRHSFFGSSGGGTVIVGVLPIEAGQYGSM